MTRVPRTGTGKNALDFQLAYYAGYLSARQPTGTVVVVSNDRGYDPMLEHARQLGFDARRYGFHRAQTPPAVPPAPTEQKSAPLPPPAPSPAVSPAAETAVKATAKAAAPQPTPAKAASARIQATRADMQQLIAQLDGLPIAHRPYKRTHCWCCCKAGWASPVPGRRAHCTLWPSCRRDSGWWSRARRCLIRPWL